jgi:hypothetical protein
MRVPSKSAVLRYFLAVALCPATLAATGGERTPEAATTVAAVQARPDSYQQPLVVTAITAEDSECAPAEMTQGAAAGAPARAPICPEGEKVQCTLGPPPVCHCE